MHCNNANSYMRNQAYPVSEQQTNINPQMVPYSPHQPVYTGVQEPQYYYPPTTGTNVQPPPTSITGMTGLPPVTPSMYPGSTTLPPGTAPVDFGMLTETPVLDIEYTQGYLKTQIGRRVKVQFLIGTNASEDRDGILVDVGISYIILKESETDDLLLCDIYSIKFVRFYY